jgi:hypothetical protein
MRRTGAEDLGFGQELDVRLQTNYSLVFGANLSGNWHIPSRTGEFSLTEPL